MNMNKIEIEMNFFYIPTCVLLYCNDTYILIEHIYLICYLILIYLW